MAWKNFLISKPTKLSCKNNNLQIDNDEGKFSFPFNDLNSLMLENEAITITKPLLCKLCENNTLLYICDSQHLPVGIMIPFDTNSNSLKVFNYQVEMKEPLKKRIWQEIVKTKLYNQNSVLIQNHIEEPMMKNLIANVKSGDIDNLEGRGASLYFKRLFGKEFIREKDCVINSRLNYGYSIIRGSVARSLVYHGFYPTYGVHHHNHLNQFNLADDFIEPFRPIVDLMITKKLGILGDFERKDKIELYNLLNYDIIIKEKLHSINNAIDICIGSFVKVISTNDISYLELPTLTNLQLHNYERE